MGPQLLGLRHIHLQSTAQTCLVRNAQQGSWLDRLLLLAGCSRHPYVGSLGVAQHSPRNSTSVIGNVNTNCIIMAGSRSAGGANLRCRRVFGLVARPPASL